MKKTALSLILALVLCLGLTTPVLAAGFTDVPPTYWAYDAIMRVTDDSQYPAAFNGTTSTTFSPEGNITRAQLIAVLNRSMNNEYWANLEGDIPYRDVPANAYYVKAMIWAKQEGILPSWLIHQSNIQPNTPLTRAEFCVILRNYDRWDTGRDLKDMTKMYTSVFSDMDDRTLGENAEDIRNAMLGWGYHIYVVNGTSNSTMSPNALVTRAQASSMLVRYWDSPLGKSQLYNSERRPDPSAEKPAETASPDAAEPQAPAPGTESGQPDNSAQDDFISEVVRLVNVERAKEGLASLKTSDSIMDAAQVRASELLQSFSHDRPDGRTCFTALDEASVRYYTAGENIAAGQSTPETVVNSWMNSPGHRANILNAGFTTIGVGHVTGGGYGHYWVQMFIG